MEQVRAVVRPPVVVSGGQFCVLLEGLHLLLVLLLELLRHSLQLQDELKRLAVDEVHVTELLRPVLQRPDGQQYLPVRENLYINNMLSFPDPCYTLLPSLISAM